MPVHVLARLDEQRRFLVERDLVMAFIRRSGIKPMLDALRIHCGKGRPLRLCATLTRDERQLHRAICHHRL